MHDLTRFWRSLDGLGGCATVAEEWRQSTGESFAFARRFLRSSGELATFYPHPDPGIRYYRVVTHGPHEHVAVCDETGERRVLSTEDLLIYELDRLALARSLVKALGLEQDDDYELSGPSPWRIGRLAPVAGYRFPAFLAVQSGMGLLEQLAQLLDWERGRFMVIAPTAGALCDSGRRLLHARGSCFLALAETTMVDGSLVLSPHGSEQLDAFRRQVVPHADDSVPGNPFPTPPGSHWSDVKLRFVDGHTLAVRVGTVSGRFNFSQMGMANRKNSMPTVQWELLRQFAAGYGILTWESPGADRKNQKRRENLAGNLAAFFRIEGDPFIRHGSGWRAVFQIEPDR